MTPTLILGNHLSSHGDSPKVCEDLADRLRQDGRQVWTASHHHFRPRRLADLTTAPYRLRRRYGVAQVDVYSGRAFLWAEAAAASLRACRKPYVLTLHGGRLPEFARRRPERVARLLRSAAAVTSPSPYLAESLSRHRGDIIVLENGIELPPDRPQLRDAPRPCLIWLRAYHEIYNSILAVETLARLRSRGLDAQLTMIGPDRGDGTWERTRRRTAELSLQDSTDLRGPLPKSRVWEALAEGEIFLNTSRADNTPVSVLEAMAAGLPIVSTDVGGISRLLTDGIDALLVPESSPEAMAQAVERLLDEEGLARKLARNARERARDFDWSRVLPRWHRLLDEIGRKPQPDWSQRLRAASSKRPNEVPFRLPPVARAPAVRGGRVSGTPTSPPPLRS